MCGIAGIWGADPQPGRLEKMVAALGHRGPDDRGLFHDETVVLGMARLAVIDLSPAAHQPMSTPDGNLWLVYNGESYNFLEEKRLLEKQGVSFSSHCDSEVVLRLYEKYGDDFLSRLRGMFALAVYDRRGGPGQERLLLARDHLGIKPLLYAENQGSLIFASEIKALLASGLIRPELDPEALRLLLTFGSVYQPHSMLSGVSMLPPAHRLIIDRRGKRLERYWSMDPARRPELAALDYAEQEAEVARLLQESLELQMVSDVPLGAFLSGGVDSTYLVALMTRAAGKRIKTFSVGFGQEGADLDESREGKRTAEFLGAEHTHVLVTGAQARDRLEHFIRGLDQPSVDGLNSYFVSWAARQAVTVAISGTGGDELFAGYPWFAQMMQYSQRAAKHAQPNGFKRLLGLGGKKREPTKEPEPPDFLTAYALTYQIYGPLGAEVMLAPDLRGRARAGRSLTDDLAPLDQIPGGDPVQRTTALCLGGYTGNQLLRDIDAVSMAHSLEVRVPYLDVPLLEASLSLPPGAKIGEVDPGLDAINATYRDCGNKRILIDAGRERGLLPADIDCQPKRGFNLPLEDWLRGPLSEVFHDTLSVRSVKDRGWLDPVQVDYVRESFLDRSLSWPQPWLLMVLELWGRLVLDPAGRT